MQFDTLVSNILHESTLNTNTLPVLDGKREMYEITIYGNYKSDRKINCSEVYRVSERDATLIDDQYAMQDYGASIDYSGSSVDEAMHALCKQYIENFEVEIPQNIIDKIHTALGKLKGTWHVLNDVGNANSIGIGVDVDINHYINQSRSDTPFKDFDF